MCDTHSSGLCVCVLVALWHCGVVGSVDIANGGEGRRGQEEVVAAMAQLERHARAARATVASDILEGDVEEEEEEEEGRMSTGPSHRVHSKPLIGSVAWASGPGGTMDIVSGFRLFLSSRQTSGSWSATTAAQTRVISCVPTPVGLQERLLATVVSQERAALEEQRFAVQRDTVALQRQTKALADELLARLTSVQGTCLSVTGCLHMWCVCV